MKNLLPAVAPVGARQKADAPTNNRQPNGGLRFFNYLILLLLVGLALPYTAVSQAAHATGGSGLYKNNIWWLTFSGVSLPAGGSTSRDYTIGNATVHVTISNVTFAGQIVVGGNPTSNLSSARLQGYIPGTYSGDGMDDVYNIGGTGTSNTLANALVSTPNAYTGPGLTTTFLITAYMTTPSGLPTDLSLVFGNGEDDGGNGGEYEKITTNGSTWQLLEKAVQNTQSFGQVTFSNTNTTAQLQGGDPNGTLPANVGLLYSTKTATTVTNPLLANVQLYATGQTAIALGLITDQDFSDAPTTYGTPAHVFQPFVSGGNPSAASGTFTNYFYSTGTQGGTPVITAGTLTDPTNLKLGPNAADADPTPFPGVAATGDDLNNIDDEDGVASFPTLSSNTTSYSINVAVSNNTGSPATVAGWIDFNQNGVFDASEGVTATVPTGTTNGTVTLSWPSITVVPATSTYARFRITTDALTTSSATTAVIGGEVEDYQIIYATNTISGNVFNDANGLTDGIVNGAVTNAGGLNAVLINAATGLVVATTAVPTTGIYSFSGVTIGNNYNVEITTSTATVESAPPTVTLPTGWVNTGSQLGSGTASNTTPGILAVGVLSTAASNANFGIDRTPTANAVTASITANASNAAVPTLTGTDPEDGTYNGTSGTNTIIIKTLPTNGTLKYNGVAVTAGQTITNYNPALLTVTPNSGNINLSFTYQEVDAANQPSTAATVTIPFYTQPTCGGISDNFETETSTVHTFYADPVFAYGGCSTGNGVIGTNPTNLIGGGFSQTTPVDHTTGTGYYLMNGTPNGCGSPGTVWGTGTPSGRQAIAVTAGLTYRFTVWVADISPQTTGSSLLLRWSTNGTTWTTINTLNTSTGNWVPLTGLVTPSGSSIYLDIYDQTNTTGGNDFGLDDITFNPAYNISGTVYNDANGLTDNTVNGTGTNAGGINAVLYDNTTGFVTATTAVAANGTYTFASYNNGDAYTVYLTTTPVTLGQAAVPAITLPPSYISTGEYLGSGPGSDGTVNSILSLGAASCANVTNANFGITQVGYIYVHKRGVPEADADPNFNFSLSGSATTYPVSDRFTFASIIQLGGSADGSLYAVASPTISSNYSVYYRAAGSTIFSLVSGAAATSIDGAGGNSAIYSNAAGQVFLLSGGTSTNITGNLPCSAAQVSSNWAGIYYVRCSNNNLYTSTGTGVWTQVIGQGTYIDAFPNSIKMVVVGTDNHVRTYNNDGTNIVDLGIPSSNGTAGVAVTGDGTLYALSGYLDHYNGTSWVVGSVNGIGSPITGGPANQIWGLRGQSIPGQAYSIATSINDNVSFDDERFTAGTNDNSVIIPVLPGSYTVSESAPSGWATQLINVYDPSNNSTASVASNTATVNITANEMVHVIWQNGILNPVTLPTNCATTLLFTENFGTTSGYGPPITTTGYHYQAATNIGDGFYGILSNTSLAGGPYGNYNDHTSGNGTGDLMFINANYVGGLPDEVYRRQVIGLKTNGVYNFCTWMLNTNNSPVKPNVTFKVTDPITGNILGSVSSGQLTSTGVWTQFCFNFTATQDTVNLIIENNTVGGSGGDYALDDISLSFVPAATPVLTTKQATCATPDSITVTAPVGANYEYSIDGTNFQSSTLFKNLNPGIYTISVRYVGTTCTSTQLDTIYVPICGTVYNDANGLTDNTVNGVGANAGGLNAVLYDITTGKVASVVAIPSTGVYTLYGLPGDNFKAEITTNTATVGGALPAAALPAGWVNTGENLGAGAGSDGAIDGILTIGTVSVAVANANFGIEQRPTAGSGTASLVNQNGTTQVTVPATAFTSTTASSDPSPGAVTAIKITTFPTGATTIVINGTSYTSATFPVAGITVPTDASGNPTQTITVDPTASGATSVTIPFQAVDAAGVVSSNTGNAVLTFTAVSISGTVYDDANGLTDNTVNGTGSNGGGLNAVLVDAATGKVVATTTVAANGTYSFAGQNGGNYNVLITTNTATVGNAAPAVALPAGYVSTGENLGSGTGSDGTPNGILPLGTVSATTTNANFGIDRTPTAAAVSSTTQQNPGGNVKLTVPTLTGSDPEDQPTSGSLSGKSVLITTLPSNGTLYYNGVAVTAGQTITSYNPALLTLDPNDGVSSVTFTYQYVDAAGQASPAATVTMPFIVPVPFTCSALAYQVGGTTSGSTANNFYSYNVATGVRTLIKSGLSVNANAIGYNTIDNLIWGFDNTAGNLIRIDATGSIASFTIPNLPNSFNSGAVVLGGYLYLFNRNATIFYVVDINPAHSTYLQMVDPNISYAVDASPYGTSLSQALDMSDWVYNTSTGTLQGMINATGGTNAYKIASVNPVTGAVSFSAQITGSTIQSESDGFGAIFTDATNTLYVFANNQGIFYKINTATNTATLVSNSSATFTNDGASCPTTTFTYYVSGSVYDDANGLSDNTVNGTAPGIATSLNAILYDNTTGAVAAVVAVAANGTYSLPATPGDNFSVYLSTASPTVGSAAKPAVTLPTGWVNIGSQLGGGTASNSTPGILALGTVNANTPNANLGIDQLPTGTNATAATQPNPGGSAAASVPATVFNGTDPEDGTYSSNLSGRTVILNPATNGTLYYNGVAVTSTTTITNFNPAKVSLHPTATGATSPTFTYNVVDNAGVSSAAITATVPFSAATRAISGTVWNDVNGDAINASETFTNAGGLYANLVSSSGLVIQSVSVDPTTGAYSLGGSASTAYSIILTNGSQTIGSTLTTATLPTGWVNTGVNLAGTASTTNKTGIISVASGTGALASQNFGVEQSPTAGSGSSSAINTGSTAQITVPASTFTSTTPSSDPSPGGVTAIKITAFPTGASSIVINGTSYTSGTFPGGGVTVPTDANGNPTQTITVDPTANGITTVTIPFVAVDAAGVVSSNTGSAVFNLAGLNISGTVYNDVNGLSDNTVNGTGTNVGGTLYAISYDNTTGQVAAITPVAADGSYTVGGTPGDNMSVYITTNTATVGQTAVPIVALPAGYVSTGENLGSGTGSDGTPNSILNLGTLNTNTSNANFGIEQSPTAGGGSNSATNQGTTTPLPVPASTFTNTTASSDPSPGGVTAIKITAFPTGASSIVINGTSYTSGTFPGGGVTVPTDASGNPTQTITVVPSANGANTVSIPFVAVDAAGVPSSNTGSAVLNVTGVSVSGTVYNDVNGLADNTVNGTGTNAGGLNAVLVDASTGKVVATTTVAADGTYSLPNVSGGNYNVEITTNTATVGNAAPAVALPSGWANTGSQLGSGTASNTTPGILPLGAILATTANANFGIEQKPTAGSGSSSATNLGSTTQVTVPPSTFTNTTASTDPSPGGVTAIKITLFPVGASSIVINGTSYTIGTFPVGGVTVPTDASGNPTQTITVAPTSSGATSVTIPFLAVDAAGVVSSNGGIALLNFNTVAISGTVYNDVNGLSDNTVNGTGTNVGGTLNAIAYDNETGQVVSIAAVAADGTYTVSGTPGDHTSVYITTNTATVGQTAVPVVVLPAGYVSTGENLGSGTGSDGTPNGILPLGVLSVRTLNANFGIEQSPTAGSGSSSATNLGSTTQVSVPASTFTNTTASSDPSPGGVTAIKITTFPTGASSIVINGTSYTSGTFPVGGVTVPTDASGNPTQPITVAPTASGATTVSIPFVAVDAAGVVSSNTGNAVMNFSTVGISGTVYNDVNGLSDNTVNGAGTNVGGTLNAIAYDNTTGQVASITAVAADGTYSLSGTPGDNISVYITTNTATVGQTAVPVVALPAGYVSTGENLGSGAGSDGTPNSILPLGTVSASTPNANFGIEQPPTAGGGSNNATNLGSTTQVTVPPSTFTSTSASSDPSPGGVTAIKITTFPTGASSIVINGTSYTSGTFPVGGVTVPTDASGNPAQTITVAPATNGAATVSIPFVAVDAAGVVSSNTGNAVMNFSTVGISGTLYDDANGLTDNTVNGTGTNLGGTLNAIAYDNTTGKVASIAAVAADGTYSLSGTPGDNISVYITTNTATVGQTAVPVVALPAGYVSTGENLGSGTGSDGTPNGILPLGTVSAITTNANFGIDGAPTAAAVSSTTQQNPGGNYQLTVPTLTGSDPEDQPTSGSLSGKSVLITTLPTNGTLYYNGVAVTAGQTITSYNPALLTLDPNDGVSSVTFTYQYVDNAGQPSTAATVTMPFTTPTAFTCANTMYEVAGSSTSSTLSTINVNTGATTAIASYGVQTNCIAFNPFDNLIWGLQNGNQLVRIDANGTVQNMNVPNLTFTGSPAIGAISTTGYYYISTSTAFTAYYVIDLNPARSTYLQIVNRSSFAAITSAPYSFAPSYTAPYTGVGLGDWAYNTADGMLWGIAHQVAGATPVSQARLFKMDPVTGAVTIDAPVLTPNLGNTSTLGSIVIDATGYMYAKQNNTGNIYKVNMTTGGNSLLSTAAIVTANDGAACPTAILSYPVSGTVYNDVNGLTDNTVNGTVTNAGGLNAILYDNTTGAVAAVVAVAANGTYTLPATPGDNFSVYLSTASPAVGSTATPTVTLPTGWANTGSQLGSGTASNNTPGILPLGTVSASTANANFGIEQPPTAGGGSNSATNLGSTTQVTVPASTFTNTTASSDPSPGGVTGIQITAFPTGASSIVINGTSYTSATFPVGGVTVPTDASGNPTQTITVAPAANNTASVSIPFVALDAAGVASSNTGSAVLNFSTVSISGTVYDDANGLSDNTVNGTGTNAGGTLNAIAYDNTTGQVVSVAAVAANGTYSLSGTAGDNISVYITTNTATVGQTAVPIVALPAGYVSTGENLGSGTGSDGTPNGILPLGTVNATTANANFGIDQTPTANTVSLNNQTNPGGTNTVQVPTLTGSDPEDGNYTGTSGTNTVKIVTVPTNGTLYYNGTAVTAGQVIANYVPASLTLDPNDGMITVSFTYSEIDAAGQPSSPANASITFSLALPVTLTSFTGTASQCNVTLDWTTTNAVNFGYFELEYSSDGTNYSAIGKIMGIPGSGPKAYSFVYGGQSTPIGYYRLKMVDLDGSFTYSNVVLVRSLCIGNLATVLPNPVRDVVTINGLAGNEAIKIYDASGRLILVRQVANTQERINMSSFSGGIYQLIIISGNNKQMQVVKLVKQ